MGFETKGELIVEFITKCNVLETMEKRRDEVRNEVNRIELAISGDMELMESIQNHGIIYGEEIVRYDEDLKMLEISKTKAAENIQSALSIKQQEILS